MRCECCNKILNRTNGKRLLPDGTKVEETFCNECRQIVNLAVKDIEDYDTKTYRFEGLVEQQLRYGAVTPPRKIQY